MKWNELADEAKVELTQDLMYIDPSVIGDCLVATREEITSLLSVAYPAGSIFTVDAEEEVLCDKGEGILVGHYDRDKDIQSYFKVL